ILWQPGTRLWMCGISQSEDLFSIHLEILKSLADAYAQQGFQVTFVHEKLDRDAFRYRLQNSLAQSKPDAILLLNAYPRNFLQRIYDASDAAECFQPSRLVWLTDDIRHSPGSECGFSERDVVFCVDRTYVDTVKSEGAGFACHIPSATCVPQHGEYRSEYAHPIAFVGSVTDLRAELSNLRPESKEWLQGAVSATIRHEPLPGMAQLESNCQANLLAVAETICLHMAKPYLEGQQALAYALYVLANTYKRVAVVKDLIPMGLAVYGNKDWECLLGENERCAYRGPVAYQDLPDLYASANISLNIHSLQCPTCLNPRDFDVPMAGGFLLSDWVQDAEAGYLVDGSEGVFYRSTPHLKELIAYYLENQELRDRVAEAGHRRVSRDHRYINRVCASLDVLRSGYSLPRSKG
ncbi:MAG TPA: glycosyltransferase, partial [bacterium]|nr:glycosyltransferase [bacterium]HQO35156.1 glycosyltransferase [bacterium]